MRWASSQIRAPRLFFSAVMKLLKYLKRSWTSRLRAPAIFRIVFVKDWDPVACSAGTPRRYNSPSNWRAMTLLPVPGPPVTTTTSLRSAFFAFCTALSTMRYATCCSSRSTNCVRSRTSSAATVISCFEGTLTPSHSSSAARAPGCLSLSFVRRWSRKAPRRSPVNSRPWPSRSISRRPVTPNSVALCKNATPPTLCPCSATAPLKLIRYSQYLRTCSMGLRTGWAYASTWHSVGSSSFGSAWLHCFSSTTT